MPAIGNGAGGVMRRGVCLYLCGSPASPIRAAANLEGREEELNHLLQRKRMSHNEAQNGYCSQPDAPWSPPRGCFIGDQGRSMKLGAEPAGSRRRPAAEAAGTPADLGYGGDSQA